MISLLAIFLAISVSGCSRNDKNDSKSTQQTQTQQQKALQNISVRIPWLRTAATIGLEVAAEKGFFKEEALAVTINPGSVEASPLRKVLSKEDQLGLLEPAQIIMGIVKQNMPFKILALKAQKSPFCLMSRKDRGIRRIADLKGKRVGYNPLNDISYLAMLKTAGLDRKDLNEVRVQFSLEPFFQDQVEVWPSFVSNEPVVARRKGMDVSLICADDVGVHLYEAALFARKDFIAGNTKTVSGFIRAWRKGWQYALDHQAEAIDILMKRTQGLDRENERKVLEVYASMVDTGRAKTKGLLWVDSEQIGQVITILHSLGIIEQMPDTSSLVDNRFLE
jgi:NitT/TauT family transport system substrate-binding protein